MTNIPFNTFKRCDLHVHSSSCESRQYSYPEFERVLLASDLDVVAITDHNNVDAEMIERLSDAMLLNDKYVLAGVELNIHFDKETIDAHSLVLSGKSEYFHGIVWCDIEDAYSLQSAVYDLLDGIGIDSSQRENKTPKEISALSKGMSFAFSDIQSKLQPIRHFFTFHENKGDDKRNLSGYLEKGVQENDTFKHKLFFYNQNLAIEGGRKSIGIARWFEENLHATVCCFFCSDAKRLSEIGTKYTWIDFDGDLDSLNLAITDPQSRIALSSDTATNPQTNLNKYLESVKFNLIDQEGTESVCELRFSPSYNGIIGSRGSGKSMLAKILAKREISDYSSFVVPSSIQYKMAGGQYSRNAANVLYVGQGDLSGIFDGEGYSSVPFLDIRLASMKEAAHSTTSELFDAIKSNLAEQKDSIIFFLEKYGGAIKRPDVLVDSRPSGITLKTPPTLPSETQLLTEYKTGVVISIENVESLLASVKKIKLSTPYPETAKIAEKANALMSEASLCIEKALRQMKSVNELLDKQSSKPLTARDELMGQYRSSLLESNRQKSTSASAYDAALASANQFLDDLLDMRIAARKTNSEIDQHIEQILHPIQPEKHSFDEDNVEIGLSIAQTNSRLDAIKSQLKGDSDLETAMILFCLRASEPKIAKNVLNGTKYKNISEPRDCIDRFFANVEAELAKNVEFEVEIKFNGKPMAEMSPGMQAQALLKLLLHDKLKDDGYDFVIFDQPEDNLDTPTISEVLVGRIKKLKRHTQVFVVSHSAPVIVNGDARSVIMAEENSGTISYSIGAINGKATKQAISHILDGGERFLKMRLYKYDFEVEDER